MKKVFQLFLVGLAVMMFAVTAHAYTDGHKYPDAGPTPFTFPPPVGGTVVQPNDMVAVSERGVGDLLIYPLYVAAPEFSTKLTVVNTNRAASTVAKLVVREGEDSVEVLNFYIYLSPADVWTGYIYYDAATGTVRMWSNDDSITNLSGLRWISENESLDVALVDADQNWNGYVEVYNVATYDAAQDAARGLAGDAQFGLQAAQTDKADIKNWFWNEGPMIGLQANQLAYNIAYDVGGVGALVAYHQRNYNRNVLTGKLEIVYGNSVPPFNAKGVASAALQAKALKDFYVTRRTPLGDDMQIRTASQFTNLSEVEAVLATRNVMMPYVHQANRFSFHFFTQPTKYSQEGPADIFGNRAPASAVFLQNAAGALRQSVRIDAFVFDTMETPLVYQISPSRLDIETEVKLITTFDFDDLFAGDMFDEGWIDYVFVNRDRAAFATNVQTARVDRGFIPRFGDLLQILGLPSIPTHLKFDGYGMNLSYGAGTETYNPIGAWGGRVPSGAGGAFFPWPAGDYVDPQTGGIFDDDGDPVSDYGKGSAVPISTN